VRTLLLGEVVKLRTTRLVWIVLGVSELVVTLGITGVLVQGADPAQPETLTSALGHVGLVSLFALVLGIFAVAGEYRYRTITDTYLGAPHRDRVVLAKLVVYTCCGLLLGLVAAATGLVVAAVGYSLKGAHLDLGGALLWRTLVGCVLWNAAFAAIGVGLGAILRNLAAALITALAWLAVVEGVVASLLGSASRWLPYASGGALGDISGTPGALSQAAAGAVLLGYTALFALLGIWTTGRRDVS
jgi:ABC-2 type transport system permease protein